MAHDNGTAGGLRNSLVKEANVHKVESFEVQLERSREQEELLFSREQQLELWWNLGDDGLRKAAYRGG